MSRLAEAIAAARAAGVDAALAPRDVDDELATLAAAVCADAPAAAAGWAAEFGRPASGFEGAAAKGRAWRSGPTPLLSALLARDADVRPYATALAGVAVEACSLDPDPSLASINAAGFAARAQLAAAGTIAAPAPPEPTGVTPAPPAAPPAPLPTLAELLARLDALIGLKAVKDQVHRQAQLLRVSLLRAEKGLRTPEVSRHLVFVGNPGTGKTTVARLVAGIYRAIGLLEGGQLVETDRGGLVAGYLGQTALKTAEVVQRAIGGVLFVDEAYALTGDQYGDEAVATLVKAMEDHRDDLVLIVAGYPEEMAELIASNPGLESRFGTTIIFPDYTDDELVAIFRKACADADYRPTDGCVDRMRQLIAAEPRDKGFGNGRFVRNLFEAAVASQAWRLRANPSPDVDDLRRLRAEDLPAPTPPT